MVAIGLSMSPPLVERVAAHYDDKKLLNRICDEAKTIAKAHESAGRGTAAHRIAERVDMDVAVIDTAMSAAVREQWTRALDEAGLDIVPDYIERIVCWPEQKICGRFDRIARRRSDGALVVVDLKTGANVVEYPHAIACQLALYTYAPLLAGPLPPHGGTTTSFEAWPPDDLDLEQGVIIHMPAEGPVNVVDIDIVSGWKTVENIIFPTLEWRARKDLAQIRVPANIIPFRRPSQTRLAWVQARVDVIKATADHRARLAEFWSRYPEIPTFPKGGPRTDDELETVIIMCDQVELEFGLPFGPSDPTAPQATTIKKETKTP